MLLRLGGALEPARAHYLATVARKREAREAYEAACPPVPDDLVVIKRNRLYGCHGDEERDVEGEFVYLPNGRSRRLHYTRQLEAVKAAHHPRSYAGRLTRAKLPISRTYEARVRETQEATGIMAAIDAHHWAGRDVEKLNEKIAAEEARTFADIAIKARALVAACEGVWGADHRTPAIYGRPLAEAICRLVEARA